MKLNAAPRLRRAAGRWLSLLAVLFAALGFSRASRAADNPSAEPVTQAIVQSDGICSRVVDGLWTSTDHYWHHGDYNRDIALIRVIVSIDPSFTEAYSTGTWLIWSMGDTPAADALLRDGIAHSTERAEIEYEFGWHLYNTKRYADAVPYLKRSVAEGSTDPHAYAILAHSYRQLGKYDEAIAIWKQVIAKFPAYSAAPSNLQRVIDLKKNGVPPTPAPDATAPAKLTVPQEL